MTAALELHEILKCKIKMANDLQNSAEEFLINLFNSFLCLKY